MINTRKREIEKLQKLCKRRMYTERDAVEHVLKYAKYESYTLGEIRKIVSVGIIKNK